MNTELPEALRILLQVIDVFEELGADYHVGGSYASSVHGVPRQTQNIDLVLEMGQDKVDTFTARLEGEYYLDRDSLRRAVSDRSSANLIHLETGIKIDLFIHGDTPFDKQEFARARSEIIWFNPELQVKIKSAEDTILRKLQWYRLGGEVSDRQWNDIQGIIKAQQDRLDVNYLKHWAEILEVGDLLDRAWE